MILSFRLSSGWLGGCVALWFGLAGLNFAQAGVVLQIFPQTATVAPGGTGTFEVLFTNTGGDSVFPAAFDLNLVADAGISFTNVSTSTVTDPYLFTGMDTVVSLGYATFTNDSLPTGNLSVADTLFTDPYKEVLSGASYGLALVSYKVDSNATAGSYNIEINPASSALYDAASNDISGGKTDFYSFQNATITVSAATSVPEPSSLMLAGLGSLTALVLSYRVRHQKTASDQIMASKS